MIDRPYLYPAVLGALLISLLSSLTASGQSTARQGNTFIENRGQWDRRARFLLRSPGLDLWISDDRVIYDLAAGDRSGRGRDSSARSSSAIAAPYRTSVEVEFAGAAPEAAARGEERADGQHNYFIGSDRSRWATNVPLYHRTRIENLYAGIDALFYLDGNRPRYDLIVAPGADPLLVRMKFGGAGSLHLDRQGALVISTPLGEIRQQELFAYQIRDGVRERVECGFRIDGDNVVGFVVGAYDHARPLVIDPVVIAYSTYFGGSESDGGGDVAVDDEGNIYLTGTTGSTDFPTKNALRSTGGGYTGIVAKLTAAGTLVYSTYFGGGGEDQGLAIAVDGTGAACITGYTTSPAFPLLNPVQSSLAGSRDAFVAKLSSNGALVYSTYLGGAQELIYGEMGHDIAVDGSGNAYVTGLTRSTDFPTLNAMQPRSAGFGDAFVTKLSPEGVLLYSTYLGGQGEDPGNGIAVDGDGNVHITGSTNSVNFPTLNPLQSAIAGGSGDDDAYITRLAPDGSLLFSTFLGGTRAEFAYGIAVDGGGNSYVIGITYSLNFPTRDAAQSTFGGKWDMFMTKLTSGGSLSYSTFLGGADADYAVRVAADSRGNACFVGNTISPDFPMMNALQPSPPGNYDGVVARLAPDGALVYSSFLGGESIDHVRGVAVDENHNAYVTGLTSSADFPLIDPLQDSIAGDNDLFLYKLSFGSSVHVAPADHAEPAAPVLDPPMPNPAIGELQATYRLPRAMEVVLEVYSDDGRLVARPVDRERSEAGAHVRRIPLGELPSGIYLLRLTAGEISWTRTFIVSR